MCYFLILKTQRLFNTEGYYIHLYPFSNNPFISTYSVSGTGLKSGNN